MPSRPNRTNIYWALLVMVMLVLQGCTNVTPRFEAPTVKISSLKLLDSTGFNQRFRIGLLLTNPNAVSLPVAGMSYTLSLNGYDLISGVSSSIPNLIAYSETPITIDASADLVAALGLLNAVAREPLKKLQYRLIAKIEFKGWFPSVNLEKDGLIKLN